MKTITVLLLFFFCFKYTFGQTFNPVDGALSPDQTIILPFTELTLSQASSDCQLPDFIDHSNESNNYFPGWVYQAGASCVQVSEISWCLTYEINRLRKVPAGNWLNHDPNLFYYYYTYNFLCDNDGSKGTSCLSGFNLVHENGCPMMDSYYHPVLGGSARFSYWMSGYDKHYQGKSNSINGYNYITFPTSDYDSLSKFKHWLSDHNEGLGASGGVAVIVVFFNNVDYEQIPNSDDVMLTSLGNDDGEPGHALTVVGYNDTIGFDFNGDTLITIDEDTNNDSVIDLRDREVGALKIINGHPGFGYAGYAYLPYKLLPTEQMKEDYAYFCHAEIRELPEYEIKVAISYNSRKKLTLAYNYALDANCQTPPNNYYKLISSYFANGGDSIFMQGISTEPLEIALNFGTDYPDADFGKIFFRVNEIDSLEYYDGEINSFSFMDYSWGETFEIECEHKNVPIVYGSNIFSINYDLLPHHDDKIDSNLLLYSDMVSRF